MKELDRVLGKGAVQGSVNLVGGDPGIGKSTLLLQMCKMLDNSKTVLYCSAEESAEQIKMRADRLVQKNDNIYIASKTNIEQILDDIARTIKKHCKKVYLEIFCAKMLI